MGQCKLLDILRLGKSSRVEYVTGLDNNFVYIMQHGMSIRKHYSVVMKL